MIKRGGRGPFHASRTSGAPGDGATASNSFILREDGSFLLREDGSKFIRET